MSKELRLRIRGQEESPDKLELWLERRGDDVFLCGHFGTTQTLLVFRARDGMMDIAAPSFVSRRFPIHRVDAPSSAVRVRVSNQPSR